MIGNDDDREGEMSTQVRVLEQKTIIDDFSRWRMLKRTPATIASRGVPFRRMVVAIAINNDRHFYAELQASSTHTTPSSVVEREGVDRIFLMLGNHRSCSSIGLHHATTPYN